MTLSDHHHHHHHPTTTTTKTNVKTASDFLDAGAKHILEEATTGMDTSSVFWTEEIALWLSRLLYTYEDWSLGPQNPCNY